MSDPELTRLADLLAARLIPRLGAADGTPHYVRGTAAISRFLGVSEDTYRRHHRMKIPHCGYEEYNHRGKLRLRPVCTADDLKKYRENLPKKNNPKV